MVYGSFEFKIEVNQRIRLLDESRIEVLKSVCNFITGDIREIWNLKELDFEARSPARGRTFFMIWKIK